MPAQSDLGRGGKEGVFAASVIPQIFFQSLEAGEMLNFRSLFEMQKELRRVGFRYGADGSELKRVGAIREGRNEGEEMLLGHLRLKV